MDTVTMPVQLNEKHQTPQHQPTNQSDQRSRDVTQAIMHRDGGRGAKSHQKRPERLRGKNADGGFAADTEVVAQAAMVVACVVIMPEEEGACHQDESSNSDCYKDEHDSISI